MAPWFGWMTIRCAKLGGEGAKGGPGRSAGSANATHMGTRRAISRGAPCARYQESSEESGQPASDILAVRFALFQALHDALGERGKRQGVERLQSPCPIEQEAA